MILKINNIDFSGNVVADEYDVSSKDIYIEWEDGFFVTHRHIVRTQVTGTFQMYFNTMTDYDNFLSALQTVRTQGYYPIVIKDNALPSASNEVSINAFIELNPIRYRKLDGSDALKAFAVEIKEA